MAVIAIGGCSDSFQVGRLCCFSIGSLLIDELLPGAMPVSQMRGAYRLMFMFSSGGVTHQ